MSSWWTQKRCSACCPNAESLEPLCVAGGNADASTTLANSLAVPSHVDTHTAYNPPVPLLVFTQEEQKHMSTQCARDSSYSRCLMLEIHRPDTQPFAKYLYFKIMSPLIPFYYQLILLACYPKPHCN